ncbi:RagB/SusD family nutrient uptake outer membrane protein [Pedobacter sp. ISL-68]|uniref:RagB/SusD family nutrient uptake outer membrane protein n=1 Tax=unclassified Pedobacter TaxID=2628915 RepID=UPI001BE893EE|nr:MULTISPECIES: RagB/SusD family nutrient uptake outer membrane protein [unclassified Pedobacter]MBT2560199.1 RagB/SusD family nutrient uptake outer membrane protein [Pedobacter sp. ISL-64]MBT2589178.1 RagB/SusD family nutrient uptake outer membrane protein [Pedobacter sp. ISL-68]
MKRIVFILMALLSLLSISSCEKYTDIEPKGKNLLGTVDEMAYLLNYNFSSSNAFYLQNLYILDNDMYPPLGNVANTLSGPKDVSYALLAYDESINRASTSSDPAYLEMYSVISNRLNVIITLIDKANGNKEKGAALKAEALTLRAYLHYILVNIYAKAYTPATAATDGGIAYMSILDYESSPVKNTVAEVYAKMLEDINAALGSGALPDQNPNSTKVGKAFAYAVKARILLSMRNYTDALAAAETALTFNSALEDHRPFISTGLAVRSAFTSTDNLFFAASKQNLPTFYTASVEVLNQLFEPGNIMKNYTSSYSYTLGGVNYSVSFGTQYGIPGALWFYNNNYQHNNVGMTVSDLMLMRAECLIRTGRIAQGMEVVNYIRQRRIHPNNYTALVATDEATAMRYFKRLSRLEFLYTWKNFADLKRWNTESAYKETITRTVNGVTYKLEPGSPLWIFPFPQSATLYNTNLTQNY